MNHLPTLISDLAVILLAAGIITLLFKAIKQPVVLGYILAGIIAGPSLNLFNVSDIENIRTWADIGVIFLLFSLGLDFSFKRLFKVGGTAFITATTIIVAMLTLGYLTGKLLGWSHINSLFLGGMLSMSSTTIIIKSFDDMGLRQQLFAGLVIGVLIVEDIVAVVLMVLLTTISVSNDFSGQELLMNILRLGMFMFIWFISGIYLIPTFLKKTKKWLTDETLLIFSLGLCFGMVLLATKIGFSAALGAFVMGSLLAETLDAERIEHITRPVKDFFGAIFFVSVGMMINPLALGQYWLPILLITLVVIVGQITFGSLGMIFSGQPLRVALQSGFSLAQVGEFAFIIATLGVSLRVTDSRLYPIIVAVSVITTFLTPFFMRMSEPAYKRLMRSLPQSAKHILLRFSNGTRPPANKENAWLNLLKDIARVVLVYTAISIAILFFGLYYLVPFVKNLHYGIIGDIAVSVIIILAMAPFLRAMMMKKNNSIQGLIAENNMSRGPLIGLMIVRVLIAMALVMFVVAKLFHLSWIILIAIALGTVIITLLSQTLKRSSIHIEKRFLSNLTERQQHADSQKPVSKEFVRHLLARDIHLAEFELQPQSPLIGKPLKGIHLRQTYGINIVSIIRGENRINIPGGEEQLFPHDRIVVVGTDHQMMRFNYVMEECASQKENSADKKEVVLEQIYVDETSKLIGKTIGTAKLRDKYRCMVVGIERGERSKMNPEIDEVFRQGDTLWLAGEKQKIIKLIEEHK